MSAQQLPARRRSTDSELAVVIERLDTLDEGQTRILRQVTDTNSRVSELEVKERIRQDREEQKAIRDAAAEAAKYRIEQQERDERELAEQATANVEQHEANRVTWRVMVLAAVVGALTTVSLSACVLLITGHV